MCIHSGWFYMRKDSLKKKRSWPTQEVLSLLQDIREFSERLRDIFHLHSIIIEIAHLLLLNTEHKERNVWKHFNLREAGGKKRKEQGRKAERWSDMNCLTDDCRQTKAGDVSSAGKAGVGLVSLALTVCTTCLTPLQSWTSQRNTMGGLLWHDMGTVLSFYVLNLNSIFFFWT